MTNGMEYESESWKEVKRKQSEKIFIIDRVGIGKGGRRMIIGHTCVLNHKLRISIVLKITSKTICQRVNLIE